MKRNELAKEQVIQMIELKVRELNELHQMLSILNTIHYLEKQNMQDCIKENVL